MRNHLFLLNWIWIGIFLVFPGNSFAQFNGTKSGSFQIILQGRNTMYIQVNGLQQFSESCRDNLIISTIFPGEYEVIVTPTEGSRNRTPLFRGFIRVFPDQRTTLHFEGNKKPHTHMEEDRNSVFLCDNIRPDSYPGREENMRTERAMMDARDLSQLMNQIKNEPFRDEKLEIIKESSNYNRLNTNQIREVMLLFAFDDDKLNCVKFLSRNVVDRHNLYSLGNLFDFQSTREKFYEMINRNSR